MLLLVVTSIFICASNRPFWASTCQCALAWIACTSTIGPRILAACSDYRRIRFGTEMQVDQQPVGVRTDHPVSPRLHFSHPNHRESNASNCYQPITINESGCFQSQSLMQLKVRSQVQSQMRQQMRSAVGTLYSARRTRKHHKHHF